MIAEAAEVLSSGKPKVLQFGVEDKIAWKTGLACGGTIRIFLEPLEGAGRDASLLQRLAGDIAARSKAALVTDLSTGARSLAHAPEDLGQDLAPALTEAFRQDRSVAVPRSNGEVFINMFAPTTRLVVIGAVHVAQALAPMASALGYEMVIVDPRAAFATQERLGDVRIVRDWPDEALPALGLDEATAVVVLSHDAKIDDPALIAALASNAFYVGALGSRKTHAGRIERLKQRHRRRPCPHSCADRARYRCARRSRDCALHPCRDRSDTTGQGRSASMRIASIVLAAGRSSRMGPRNKLLESIGGEPMVRRVTAGAIAGGGQPVVVVTGHEAAEVGAALHGLGVTVILNLEYADGLSTSLRAGLSALPADIDGALILLGDMPEVEASVLLALMAAFTGEERDLRSGTPWPKGNPVLWGRRYFPEMMELTGDFGAKPLMARHEAQIIEVEVATDSIFHDVDAPEDLARLK